MTLMRPRSVWHIDPHRRRTDSRCACTKDINAE